PGDERDPAPERFVALRPFEPRAEPPLLVLGQDRRHVGVEVRGAADGRERVAEADGRATGLRQQDETPGVGRRDHLDAGHDLDVVEAPDLALQVDAGVVVRAGRRQTYDGLVLHTAAEFTKKSYRIPGPCP